MVKKIFIVFLSLICCLIVSLQHINAQSSLNISQVVDDLPKLTVYLNPTDSKLDNWDAYLGEEKLVLKDKSLVKECDEGTNYYILWDCSTSIDDDYFKNIKNGLIELFDNLRNSDTLVIYTFGAQLEKITDTNDSFSNQTIKINNVQNNQQATELFKSIDIVTQECEKNTNNNSHNVIFVISDGVDFTKGETTRQEALLTLQEKNIPVYGLTFDSASKDAVDSFGEFSRSTGGYLVSAPANQYVTKITQLKNELDNSWRLEYDFGSNLASNQKELLTLKNSATRENVSKEVKVIHYQVDNEKPEIKKIKAKSNKTMRITFSENVKNAQDMNNYTVTYNDEELKIEKVNYHVVEDNYVVDITFADTLYNGAYTIQCHNIVDNSMEKNELTKKFKGQINDAKNQSFFQSLWFRIICIIFIIIILGIVIYLVRKKRHNQQEISIETDNGNGIVYVDGGKVQAGPADIHEKIEIIDQPGKKITVDILKNKQYLTTIEMTIYKSIIIGRSSICDYYFNDYSLSRQHFVLEFEKELFVTDLKSSNGTKVNGIRIKTKMKLAKNDTISAGNLEFKVRW